jgi:hypothetical protein
MEVAIGARVDGVIFTQKQSEIAEIKTVEPGQGSSLWTQQ